MEPASTELQTSDSSLQEIITLVSSDNIKFEVTRHVLDCFVTIKNMLEDMGEMEEGQPIPLLNVNSSELERVIEYARWSLDNPSPPEEIVEEGKPKRSDDLVQWEIDFCNIPNADLFNLILAANYLDFKRLLHTCCKTVANMIKGKSTDEIREKFGIINDFTPEEEERIRKENEWCEER